MRILIDEKPSDPLTPAQRRDISLWTMKDLFQGAIFTPDEATHAYIAKTKWSYIVAVGLFATIGWTLALFVDAYEQAAVIIGVLIMSALLSGWLLFMLRRKVRIWNEQIGRRLLGLVPSSGKIGFDRAGLSVGDKVLPWNTLEMQQVNFIRYSVGLSGGRRTTMYIIERLALASPSGPVVLDTAMMGNGRLIVDNIWRRLTAAPSLP
jgi:hypothetical protein